jgi:tetratricopeptide (TPR) repeat protein
MARSFERLERPAEAIQVLDKAIPRFKNPLPAQTQRVRLLRATQGLQDALETLQALVDANPQDANLWALYSEWQQEAGDLNASVKAARQALHAGGDELTPEKRSALHLRIGLQTRQTGQLDQAIYHLSQAVSGASGSLDAYMELGRAFQERREYRRALEVYEKAMKVAPRDYRPYYQAGMALKDSKDYLGAEKMLRRAAQLSPNEVGIHRLLGAVVALNLVHNRALS